MDNSNRQRSNTIALSPIHIPRIERPSPEEIERRRALFAKVMERRERIGPIGISSDELLHLAREDADAAYE